MAPLGCARTRADRKEGATNCSVAIQYLPLDAADDDETCRVVDAVIAYIASTGVPYWVGPFETAIEGDYDTCMDVVRGCQLAGAKAGCAHAATYVKIDFKAAGDVLTTERKVGKYHAGDAAPETGVTDDAIAVSAAQAEA